MDLHPPPHDLDLDLDRELRGAYRAGAGPIAQAATVCELLRRGSQLQPGSVERLSATIAAFGARQQALGRRWLSELDPDDAAGFVWARTRRGHAPAIATLHLRRTALRLLVRCLDRLDDPPAGDPTAGLALPPRTRRRLRALDDDEIALLRIAATTKPRSRQPSLAALALAEAAATTGEIAQLHWAQIDLEDGVVELPGAGPIRARTAPLTVWGRATLTRYRAASGTGDGLLVYRGSATPQSQPAQAAVVNRLRRLLAATGLTADDVRPASIRLWSAVELLTCGGTLVDAANRLGLASLDVAAELLDYPWQQR